MHSAEWNK